MVSQLTFYSDDSGLNPAKVYSSFSKNDALKEAVFGPFKKWKSR